MTVIVSMLLYIFGLDASTGKLNYYGNEVKVDSAGNVIIYDPEYNPAVKPVYYQSPNIIVPNPNANNVKVPPVTTSSTYNPIPYGSSSPEYQS
jgi:hypothetical protein